MAKPILNKKSKIKIPPIVKSREKIREYMSMVGLKKNEVNRGERFKGTRANSRRVTSRRLPSEKWLGAGHQKGKK